MTIFTDITLIIVCYNSYELLKKNFDVLKKFKCIIYDNSSCELTSNLLKSFTNIKYIKSKKNIGYGRANNLAVAEADTKYILILNPDIKIDDLAISNLYSSFLKYQNCGIIGPSLYDENLVRRTNGSISFLKKKINSPTRVKIQKFCEGDACYDYIIGCALFMEKTFFERIGGFDNDFFLYFEDNEICDRVYKNGKVVIETTNSKMLHYQAMSGELSLSHKIRLSLIHKISEYIYLKKNISKYKLYILIFLNFIDFLQRMFFGFVSLKFEKSFKNFLRIISILLFLFNLHKLVY